MNKKKFFNLDKDADKRLANLWLLEPILDFQVGDDVSVRTPTELVEAFNKMGAVDEIVVHLNSPGGNVFYGVAIYNLLKHHSAKVTVIVEGMAGSIASIIAMAGDTIKMATGSMMFIHDPWTCICADADQMRASADDLDKIAHSIVDIYHDRTGLEKTEIERIMKADTYLNAEECLQKGLADEIDEVSQVAAFMNPQAFYAEQKNKRLEQQLADLQNQLVEAKQKPTVATAEQVIDACGDNLQDCVVLLNKQKLTEVQLQTAVDQLGRIKQICDAADLNASLFNAQVFDAPMMLKKAIEQITLKFESEVANSLSPAEKDATNQRLSARAIYDRRREHCKR